MAVLVTGASGFLGGRLAEVLAARGEDVMILARATSDLRHLAGTKVRVVRGDLSNAAALGEAVRDATQIFHCAACSTDWAAWKTYFDANVVGTRNLLAAALRAPRLERFLHVSTTDVYGYPAVPCGEEHPIVDAGLPYNQTKGQGEEAVWRAHRKDGLPVTVVRPATIYGPRGKDFTVEIGEMLRLRLMATIDGGRAPGGFAYVDNVVDGMIGAAANGSALGEAYNLCDGTGATWLEYLRFFSRRLGTPMPWIDLSFKTADRLASVLEIPHRLLKLGGRPLLTRHAVILLGRDQEFPIGKAVGGFGFRPAVSLEEGIERSVGRLRSTAR